MDQDFYKFVASPDMTTYEIAQFIEASTFNISCASYDNLPENIKKYFVLVVPDTTPVTPPVNGGTP